MKYLILGKNVNKGIEGDDSGLLKEYFELGWEVVGSRIDLICLYNEGCLNEDEITLVTIDDRMFFYTKYYKSVISYDEFVKLNVPPEDVCGDWPTRHESYFGFANFRAFINPKTLEYVRKDQDLDLIFNGFDLEGAINPQEPFVTMCIRRRDWCSDRNSDVSFYQKIVDGIKDKFPIYVAGKGNEEFCEMNGINYVPRLKDYVALIKNQNCRCLITQSTGLAVLALTCAETDIHLVDHAGASDINGLNAISGGRPIHFFSKGLTPYYNLEDSTANCIVERTLEQP